MAEHHLGKQKDLVATPLMHDTPAEIAQPAGQGLEEGGRRNRFPGKTMPAPEGASTRDYPNTYKMMTALGPLVEKIGMAAKGVSWNAAEEY